MATIRERVEGFRQTKPTPIRRGGLSYDQTHKFTERALKLCLRHYRRLTSVDQTANLLRDTMNNLLREHHDYAIKENFGGHYVQVGMKPKEKKEFEHVIPMTVIVGLLISGRITIQEAMNAPTCQLSKRNHKRLNSNQLASSTPSIPDFFQRYQDLGVTIRTYDGTLVDTQTWDLDQHYEYFK
jgi:hypothetical protein